MTEDTDRFARLDDAFRRALNAAPGERDAVIADACGGDASLEDEVRTLLAIDDAASGSTAGLSFGGAFGEEPGIGLDALASHPSQSHPERIGEYTLGPVLGRGGMGVVYRAERTNPRRTVALKLIRHAVQSENALRRFRLEAEALARMSHPGIAALYEIGLDQTGPRGEEQPYFAMELVEGQPITAYADARTLGPRDRLALLARVCDAIDHAHTRGVVHRDLKPENIFVTAQGDPKVLDLGVAKLVNLEDTNAQTLAASVGGPTQAGQIVGTLHYMSPEQVDGDPAAIDPRCDVYALGVIGYELLSGALPISTTGVGMFEAMQRVRAQTPTPLRLASPGIDPDIATIIEKAMAKEPAGRYVSAAALAADIRRFLADEPIQARPPSTWYQLSKFTKRNRVAVGAVGAVFLVLVGALIAVGFALRSAEGQRAIAERERARAEREGEILASVNAFLVDDLLAQADPRQGGSKDTTLIAALNDAADSIGERFGDAPEAEAAIRDSLGDMYSTLNDFERAQANIDRAVALTPSSDTESRAARLNALALLAMDVGDYDAAAAALGEARALDGNRLSLPQRLETESNLGRLAYKRGDPETALVHYAAVAERGRAELPESDETLAAIGALSLIYQTLGRESEAVPLSEEAVSIYESRYGPENPDTLTTVTNHAMLLSDLGRLDEAEATLTRVLETRLRTVGPENVDTNVTRAVLAGVLIKAGRPGEARTLAEQSLAGFTAALGPDHRYTGNARRTLARADAAIAEKGGEPAPSTDEAGED